MNWLLLLDLWEDWWDGSSPPIHWNPTAQRFEFLVTPPPGQSQQVGLWMPNPHDEDGVIDFEYQITSFNTSSLNPTIRINIVESDVDGYSNVISSTEVAAGSTGRITVEARAGNAYDIVFANYEDSDSPRYFYGFEGIITPIQEVAPPSRVLPWWLCVRPAPPEPCPVRTNPAEEFVPFEDYDADFKFPLASSRKPMKIERPDGCVVCGPNLTDADDPEPEPDPEIAYAYVSFGEGSLLFPFNFPPGLNEEEPLEVFLNEEWVGAFSRDNWNDDYAWGGYIYSPSSNVPYTFRQGAWEHVCFLETDFVIMMAELPQIHPADTYHSSDLRYYFGSYYPITNDQLDFLIDGTPAWVKYEVRRGTYTWIFSENFPNGLVAYPVQLSQNGVEVSKNCFLWTKTRYPNVPVSLASGMAYISTGFNGFYPEEQDSFSVSRSGVTYNFTRTSPNNYTADTVPDPIEYDPTNPWLMTFSGGSCYVNFYTTSW